MRPLESMRHHSDTMHANKQLGGLAPAALRFTLMPMSGSMTHGIGRGLGLLMEPRRVSALHHLHGRRHYELLNG